MSFMKMRSFYNCVSLLLVLILIFSCTACKNENPTGGKVNSSDKEVTQTSSEDDLSDTDDNSSQSNFTDESDSAEDLSNNNSTSSDFEVNKNENNSNIGVVTNKEEGSPDSSKYKNSEKLNFADYSIVYSNKLSENSVRDAKSLTRAIYKVTNKYPKSVSDLDLPASNATEKEIIIGNTDRSESEKAVSLIKENRPNCYYDFIIKVYGSKIVINSISEEKLTDAIDFFVETFLENGETVIPNNYDFICYEEVTTCMSIAGTDVSKFVILCGKTPARMTYKGCEELQISINEKTDYTVPIMKEDSYEGNKILINITNKNLNDYKIEVKKKDIVITAGHSFSANAALHALASNIKVVKNGYTFDIPQNYVFKGKYDEKTVNTDGYNLVFNDEFNGTELNPKNFTAKGVDSIEGVDYSKSPYPTLNEGDYRYHTKSNVKIDDGMLNLWTTSLPIETGTAWWNSGVDGNFEYQFGLIEIRAKINKGNGFWPAFWMVGSRTLEKPYTVEIDVFEFFGNDKTCVSNIHSWWTAGRTVPGLYATDSQVAAGHIQHLGSADSNNITLKGGESFGDDFHTFACEWTPKFIEFSVDGEVYCHVPLTAVLIHPDYGYFINEYNVTITLCKGEIRMFFNKYYDNPKTLHINTVEPRAYYIPTQTKMQFDFIDARLYSDRFFTLNGQWDFKFYDSVLDVPENVFEIMLENKIKVPSIWQTEGYDFRQYVNLDYQIPFDPPYVPTENPCGVYKKRFKFDKKFEKAYLNFEGVDSCFYVWLNGNFIGFSQVSHCTSEFDIDEEKAKSEVPIILLSNTNDHAIADGNSSKIIEALKREYTDCEIEFVSLEQMVKEQEKYKEMMPVTVLLRN